MKPRFFTNAPELIADQIRSNLAAIYDACPSHLEALDKIFGRASQLVPFYIPPKCQNLNPADYPEDDTGLVVSEPIFTKLDAFLGGDPTYSHAIILSDAGLGKTSLMVMLKLAWLDKLIKPGFDLALHKLGPDTVREVEAIKDPTNCVLLLDALDEDPEAWDNLYTRLQHLLQTAKSFRKTIITCPTQFFPVEKEKDGGVPGRITLHGFACSKLFLSPFDDDQVDAYLNRRFTSATDRKKASEIVGRMRSLKFRPMLLSYVDLLLNRDEVFESVYDLYAILVDEWLNRELQKGAIHEKEPIFEACKLVALDMFKSKARFIDRIRIDQVCGALAAENGIEAMSVEGRALLHRSSDGYKFAHQSIMEFFVAYALEHSAEPIRTSDQVKAFLADRIHAGRLRKWGDLDLTQMQLNDVEMKSIEGRNAKLSGCMFVNCRFQHGVFCDADFRNAVFNDCDLSHANFFGTDLSGAFFSRVKFLSAQLSHSLMKIGGTSINLSQAHLVDADFGGAELRSITLADSQVSRARFAHAKMIESDFSGSRFADCVFTDAVLDGANFATCDLQLGCFTRSSLTRASFYGAELRGASFTDCHLGESSFQAAQALKADFSRAMLGGATFAEGNFAWTNFSGADISFCVFLQTNLMGASFPNAIAAGAKFDEANLVGADLTDAKLAGAAFISAKMDSSNFQRCEASSANFRGASLVEARFDNSNLPLSNFSGAMLRAASFCYAIATGAAFSGADLNGTDFRSADLTGAKLTGQDLRKAKLDGAILAEADLEEARTDSIRQLDLRRARMKAFRMSNGDGYRAKLNGADLTMSDLTGSDLRHAVFDGANLGRASLMNTKLENASFANADICGCDFTGASVSDTLFEGAIYDDSTRLPAGLNEHDKVRCRHRDSLHMPAAQQP